MVNIDNITKEKIERLQLIEQKLQTFLLQKQNFETQFLEINNALEELEKGVKEVYKIVGNIMVMSDTTTLKKDLNDKKDVCELRIKNLEKQENKIKEEVKELQQEVMKKLKRAESE